MSLMVRRGVTMALVGLGIGVVAAKRIDKALRYAATVVPGVSLLEYTVEFHLHEAHELPETH